MRPYGFLIILAVLSVALSLHDVQATTVVAPMYEDSINRSELMVTGRVTSGKLCIESDRCRPNEIEYVFTKKETLFGKFTNEKFTVRTSQQLCVGCDYLLLLKINKKSKAIEMSGLSLEIKYDFETKANEIIFSKDRPIVANRLYEYKKELVCTESHKCEHVVKYRYVPYEKFIKHINAIRRVN